MEFYPESSHILAYSPTVHYKHKTERKTILKKPEMKRKYYSRQQKMQCMGWRYIPVLCVLVLLVHIWQTEFHVQQWSVWSQWNWTWGSNSAMDISIQLEPKWMWCSVFPLIYRSPTQLSWKLSMNKKIEIQVMNWVLMRTMGNTIQTEIRTDRYKHSFVTLISNLNSRHTCYTMWCVWDSQYAD